MEVGRIPRTVKKKKENIAKGEGLTFIIYFVSGPRLLRKDQLISQLIHRMGSLG